MIVETPSGAVLIQAPPEQRDILQQTCHPLPLTPEEGEYSRTLPIIHDPLASFRPFNDSSASIPLVKRHVVSLLKKQLPSRAHPIFDQPPPDIQGPTPPPLTQHTAALAEADPGYSVSLPVPHPSLLVDTSINLREFSLAHFEACEQCEAFGGSRARHLPPDSKTFSTSIFTCFHPSCYAQHLFRGLWYGYDPALSSPISPFSLDNYQSLYDPAHRQSLLKAWNKQLRVPCLFGIGDPRYVSPLTLATRFIDKWESQLTGKPVKARVCFDASRGINNHLSPWKFRYADFQYILSHIKPGSWIAQLDLRGWYLQLAVRKKFQKYLSLRCPLTGKLLRYKRLPFGLSTAPGFASLVSSEICKILNAAGIKCFVTSYIDDITFIADSREEAQRALDRALSLLARLNIDVAPEKVVLPTQQPTILGIMVDTVECLLKVRPEHLQWTLLVIRSILKRKRLTKKKLQSLAGMMNWISPLCRGSRPYMRSLWDLVKCTHHTIRASPDLLSDLRWWRSALNRLKRSSCEMPFIHWDDRRKMVMFSDASGDVGCGAWIGNRFLRHKWTDEELAHSVPFKELWPIDKVLELFGDQLRDAVLLSATDSATNSFSINAGSSRAPGCNTLLKSISRHERKWNIDTIALWCLLANSTLSLTTCPNLRSPAPIF